MTMVMMKMLVVTMTIMMTSMMTMTITLMCWKEHMCVCVYVWYVVMSCMTNYFKCSLT